jgi:hypothetical protein
MVRALPMEVDGRKFAVLSAVAARVGDSAWMTSGVEVPKLYVARRLEAGYRRAAA